MNTSSPTSPKPDISQRTFRGRLARRMVFTLVPLVLVLISVTAWIAIRQAQRTLKDQIANQLQVAESSMEEDINEWLLAKTARIDAVTHHKVFPKAAHTLLTAFHESPQFIQAQRDIITELNYVNRYETYPIFNDFLVLSSDHTILASTQPQWEGLVIQHNPLATLVTRITPGAPAKSGLSWFEQSITVEKAFSPDAFHGVHFLTYGFSPFPGEKKRTLLFTVVPYTDRVSGKQMFIIGISEEVALERILNQLANRYPNTKPFFLLYNDTYLTFDPETHTLQTATTPPFLTNVRFSAQNSVLQGEYLSPITQARVFSVVQWIPSFNTAIGLELPYQFFISRARSSLPTLTRLFIIIAILLTLVIWLAITYVTRPILQVADTARRFAAGDWLLRAPVERNDEIGLLAHAFNQMADELSEFYRSLESQVEERTQQIRTASEVAALATSATELSEILRRTVDLIVSRFPQYYHASVFLLDESGYAVLAESTGAVGAQMKARGHRLKVGSESVVGWAAQHRQPRIASDVTEDPIHFKNPLLPETRSEAGIPLIIGNQVLGVLDVQSKNPQAFDEQSVATLQTLAAQLATAIYNARLREQAESGLGETRLLYGISRRLAAVQSVQEIIRVGQESVAILPYIGAMYSRDVREGVYRFMAAHHPQKGEINTAPATLPLTPEIIARYLPAGKPLVIADTKNSTLPEALLALPRALGCRTAAFLPLYNGDTLESLFLLGKEDPSQFTDGQLQPYVVLASIASAALQRTVALVTSQRRLQQLQIIVRLSQSIGTATEPHAFYRLLRTEITNAFGEVGLIVALYDPLRRIIEIPYAYEQGEPGLLNIPPMPLGEGLISKVITSRRPLLLAAQADIVGQQMGAKIVGKAAKSWLGVPLITGDQLIGALVLQDPDRENRFSERDVEFVQAIATSVALLLNKIRLLAATESAHQRERVLFEISEAARNANDVSQVLEGALRSLQRSLKARRGTARLDLSHLTPTQTTTAEGDHDHA